MRKSVATWRWACQSCTPANLGVVEIQGELFMLPALEHVLLSVNQNTEWRQGYNFGYGKPYHPDGFDPEGNVVWLGFLQQTLNLPAGGRHPTSDAHIRVADREKLVSRTCSLPRDRLPDFVRRVQDAFGCKEAVRPTQLRARPLYLLIVPKNTSCGLSKNIIGCEADGSLVELNARDYSYIGSGGRVLFGSGPPSIDLEHVTLHELGHWIGLPHLTDPDDLMESSLDKSRCITKGTMDSLYQMLAGPWKPRMKQAFYFKDPTAIGSEKGGQP